MIFLFARKVIPRPIKLVLLWIRRNIYVQQKKKVLSLKMQRRHKKMLISVAEKEKIKVVFFAIHESVWKVDSVFKYMLEDELFDPVVLVCPYTAYGTERRDRDLEKTYNSFQEAGYPVINSRNKDGSWVKLEEIKPDLICFTNPHDLTSQRYYRDAFERYLSFYVPYFYLVTSHGGDDSIYNQYFHNAMWKIFMPHLVSFDRAKDVSANNAKNCILTGYPACEPLLEIDERVDPWKALGRRKRIIFAPHHTIDDSQELRLSNFLDFADFFKNLVELYKEDVQWCFKPHPILKSKLYNHPDWGDKRTDLYYQFWELGELTQLSEGGYESIFIYSDAMIHDCGSFLAEYLYLRKPVLYLVSDKTMEGLNEFGRSALKCCYIGKREADIERFLDNIISNAYDVPSMPEIASFFRENVDPFFKNESPSEKICNLLKCELKGSCSNE